MEAHYAFFALDWIIKYYLDELQLQGINNLKGKDHVWDCKMDSAGLSGGNVTSVINMFHADNNKSNMSSFYFFLDYGVRAIHRRFAELLKQEL